MKIKMTLFFFLLCSTATMLIAQQAVNPLKMSFKNQKIKLADFPFHITQVIDARIDTHYIGFVRDRKLKKLPALTYLPLHKELSQLFERSFPQTDAREPLLLKINHFFIYEEFIKGKEHLVAEINITFILYKGKEIVNQK